MVATFGDFVTLHCAEIVTSFLSHRRVPEGVTADIVGHEKNTMTYGLYSGANALEVKRKALAKVTYEGM